MMKKIFSESSCYRIVEDNGKYGVEDMCGNTLLPVVYDSIYSVGGNMEGIGFLLCQDGRFGFAEFAMSGDWQSRKYALPLDEINGCAAAFLPCIYTAVDKTFNGLVLTRMQADGDKSVWYDFKSRTLFRDLYQMDSYADFDSFLIDEGRRGNGLPILKRAGEDAYVLLPKHVGYEPYAHIPVAMPNVTCILCVNQVIETEEGTRASQGQEEEAFFDVEEYEEIIDDYCVFSFLLLFKDGWLLSHSERDPVTLYGDLPRLIEENVGTNAPLCRYKKKYEI